ncbi:hypothetical protein GS507_23695 [Rhodococcus hoagii]|nr:hypothetical protein [Prescottella equi]
MVAALLDPRAQPGQCSEDQDDGDRDRHHERGGQRDRHGEQGANSRRGSGRISGAESSIQFRDLLPSSIVRPSSR